MKLAGIRGTDLTVAQAADLARRGINVEHCEAEGIFKLYEPDDSFALLTAEDLDEMISQTRKWLREAIMERRNHSMLIYEGKLNDLVNERNKRFLTAFEDGAYDV